MIYISGGVCAYVLVCFCFSGGGAVPRVTRAMKTVQHDKSVY